MLDLTCRALFDPAFDAGAWPGPVPQPGATVGQHWVGLRGLVDLLEIHLGLAGPSLSEAQRVAALGCKLARTRGFWSASAQVDPLGTARRLLHWRDTLMMGGWQGQPASPRLDDLWSLTREFPGQPDRLQALLTALSSQGSPLQEVVVFSHPLEKLARMVLAQLPTRQADLPDSPTRGDLLAARQGSFQPQRDGTLQLIRPAGPLEAAEEVAAWLAAQPNLEGTVILNPSPGLDRALHQAGLPTTGAPEGPGQSGLLQLLPLVLACGWDPPDPAQVLQLLTATLTPIPREAKYFLTKALRQWPAVGSPAWTDCLEEALAKVEDPKKIRARVANLLHGEAPRGGNWPASAARRRLDHLATWLRGRLGTEEGDREPWLAALQACSEFDALVAASGLEALSESQLQRLLAQALAAVTPAGPHPAQAGLHAVGHPGSLAGPARRVVWWDFTLSTVQAPGSLPLTAEEQSRLQEAGVELPDPGRAARLQAEAWRRPLTQACESLLLVCPERDGQGAEEFPHPLWDEVHVHAGDRAHLLEATRPFGPTQPQRSARALKPLAQARHDWSASPETLAPRPSESPNSLSALIGCPFAWALRYHGSVEPGGSGSLPTGNLLSSSLAHEILERVLLGAPSTPQQARQAAEALFDELGPTVAAPLFLPGADAERAHARHVTGGAAESLARRLQEAKMSVLEVEARSEKPGLDGRVNGRVDLVVGPPETILDLKWSGSKRFEKLLQDGTAHQLATYSYLRDWAPAGYFTLVDGTLQMDRPGPLGNGTAVAGPPFEETWRGLETAVRARRDEMARGRLEAPAVPDEEGETGTEESGLVEGRLVLAPECGWCDLRVLCGLDLESSEEVPDEQA